MSKKELNLILVLIIYLNKLLMFKIGLLNVANGDDKLVYVDKNIHRLTKNVHRLNKILKF